MTAATSGWKTMGTNSRFLLDACSTRSTKNWSNWRPKSLPLISGLSGRPGECGMPAYRRGGRHWASERRSWPPAVIARFSEWKAVCRMAGSGAATALQRRQDTTAGYQQTRRSLPAHAPNVGCARSVAERRTQDGSPIAVGDGAACASRLSPGDHRRGRQECTHHLGAAGEESRVCTACVAHHSANKESLWNLPRLRAQ